MQWVGLQLLVQVLAPMQVPVPVPVQERVQVHMFLRPPHSPNLHLVQACLVW